MYAHTDICLEMCVRVAQKNSMRNFLQVPKEPATQLTQVTFAGWQLAEHIEYKQGGPAVGWGTQEELIEVNKEKS